MAHKITSAVLILFLASFLNSCSKSAPDCSDTITIEKVKDLVLAETGKTDLPLELTVIKTTSFDDKTGRQECASIAKIEGPLGQTMEIPITYTSELTDKKGEYYIQITGFGKININNNESENVK